MIIGSRLPASRFALARRLQLARKKKGLSQERVAFLSGLHQTYVSLLERGRKSPTVDVLERLASALEVKPSSLIARAEKAVSRSKSDAEKTKSKS